jgi:hypothetical protein
MELFAVLVEAVGSFLESLGASFSGPPRKSAARNKLQPATEREPTIS